MELIQFDESEYQQSYLSDKTLHLIARFFGPRIRDFFLFQAVVKDVEPDSVRLF